MEQPKGIPGIGISLSIDIPALTATVNYANTIRQTQDLDLAHWWDFVAAYMAFMVLSPHMKELPPPPAPKS